MIATKHNFALCKQAAYLCALSLIYGWHASTFAEEPTDKPKQPTFVWSPLHEPEPSWDFGTFSLIYAGDEIASTHGKNEYEQTPPRWVRIRNLKTGRLRYFPLLYPLETEDADAYAEATIKKRKSDTYKDFRQKITARIERTNLVLKNFRFAEQSFSSDMYEDEFEDKDKDEGIKNRKRFFKQNKLKTDYRFTDYRKKYPYLIKRGNQKTRTILHDVFLSPMADSPCRREEPIILFYAVAGKWLITSFDYERIGGAHDCYEPPTIIGGVSISPKDPLRWVKPDWKRAIRSIHKNNPDLPPMLLSIELIGGWLAEGVSAMKISKELARAGQKLLKQKKHEEAFYVFSYAQRLYQIHKAKQLTGN